MDIRLTLEVIGGIAIVILIFSHMPEFRRRFSSSDEKIVNGLARLHTLNEEVGSDALDFCRQSWPILEESGAKYATIDIEWFGEQKFMELGDKPENLEKFLSVSRKIDCEDMVFDVNIFYKSKTAILPNTLEGLVFTNFFSILRQNTLLKEDEIRSSQLRLKRYQMFVQHEIKNIAQFITMLSTSVARITTDNDKIRLFDRLKTSLPIMESRATKAIQSMKSPETFDKTKKIVDVPTIVREVCEMFELKANVIGKAITSLRKEFLVEILKNVLGNFRDHKSSSNLSIYVYDAHTSPDQIEIQIFSEKIAGIELQPERLFEPFWTTSESGLGLGLFLAREMLKQEGGQIRFHQTQTHYGFILNLPNNSSNTIN